MRKATISRTTLETDISVSLNLDGEGKYELNSGIAFFDHMLSAFARFSLIDLCLSCKGDLQVDGHHSVEDCGIVLGQAVAKALGDKAGISRVASCFFPMDEALAFCALDISGRPFLQLDASIPAGMVGGFDASLLEEFLRAFSQGAGITLHMQITGKNAHHMLEAAFKALGRALRDACCIDERIKGVPSTKGVL